MCKVLYKIDKFTDYAGNEREFVLAAVSIEEARECDIPFADFPEGMKADADSISSIKTLSLGIAVRRPNDKYNEEIAKKIAYGKAIARRTHALMSTDSGIINTAVVNAVLEQEAEYFKRNPGRYLAGYDKDCAIYHHRNAINEAFASMSEEEKAAIDTIAHLTDDKADRFCDVLNAIDELDKES